MKNTLRIIGPFRVDKENTIITACIYVEKRCKSAFSNAINKGAQGEIFHVPSQNSRMIFLGDIKREENGRAICERPFLQIKNNDGELQITCENIKKTYKGKHFLINIPIEKFKRDMPSGVIVITS